MACIDEISIETSTEVFEKYCIVRAPAAVYYLPDFVTAVEEGRLWKCIYTAPKPKWTALSHRRLQNWGGLPHSKGMVPEPLPQWLSQYTDRVSALGVFGDSRMANHVLVNEYTAGQGIMAHVDGPLFYPTISTLSIGGHTLLNLYSLPEERGGVTKSLTERFLGSLLLEPRSLLILQQDAYTATLHDIADTDTDLVCRDRVLNWDQTALGRWAMRSSQLVANDKRLAGGGTRVPSDYICGEKESSVDCCLDFDCTHEEDTGKHIDSDTGYSLYNDKNQQENNEYGTVEDKLALGSMERVTMKIRNGENDSETILSAIHEKISTEFDKYLDKRLKDCSDSFEINNEGSNKVECCCCKTKTDSSIILDEIVYDSVAAGNAMQERDAIYSLEVKLAGCEHALVGNSVTNSDKSESSISKILHVNPLDKLTVNCCAMSNETTIHNQQLNFVSASQILGDNSSLKTSKGCHCVQTQLVPKEVCQSLAGPGHSGRAAPAAHTVTVAGKKCFLLPRGTRLSLTIRHVPKVVKTKIFLGRR